MINKYLPKFSAIANRLRRTSLHGLASCKGPISYGAEAVDSAIYFPDDAEHLQKTVGTIFPEGTSGMHPEQICIEILKFAASHIELGPAGTETSAGYIRCQRASCGGFGNVFADLTRTACIPARYFGLFGLINAGSHALAEAYYDNSWHLFDPTFGLFFYSNSDYDRQGHVLSGREIVSSKEPPTIIQVVSKPWQKNYECERHFEPILAGQLKSSHYLSYWDFGKSKEAFPIANGNRATVSFPFEIDLNSKLRYSIGEKNDSWKDMYVHYYSTKKIGYFYLGGQCPNSVHFLDIKTPGWGRLRVSYVGTSQSHGPLYCFPLAEAHVEKEEFRDNRYELVVTSIGSNPRLQIYAEHVFWIDTVEFEWLESFAA